MTDRPRWSPALLDDLLASTGVMVDRGVRARHATATDWGAIIRRPAPAVVRPTRADEVADVVRFARERGLSLTPRGSGASQGGQAVPADSVVLDLLAMSWVGDVVAGERIACGPGATWRAVLARTLPHGLVPRVVPFHLDLTVGGTISVGGIGSTSHRFGAAASNTDALTVVVGSGDQVSCDATRHPDLFDAVRAGLGRCAVIVEATLTLREVGPVTRSALLSYGSVGDLMDDLPRLRADPSIDHLQALCRRSPAFSLEVAADGPGSLSGLEKTLSGLRHERIDDLSEVPSRAFAARLDPRFDEMVISGRAGAAHPWLDAFVPLDTVVQIIPEVLTDAAGDENDRVQVIPVDTSVLPPFLATPGPGLAACIAVVPTGIEQAEIDQALVSMRRVHDRLLSVAGKRGLTGWFPATTEAMWRRHYEHRFDRWMQSKQDYDPNGTFASALLPPPEKAP